MRQAIASNPTLKEHSSSSAQTSTAPPARHSTSAQADPSFNQMESIMQISFSTSSYKAATKANNMGSPNSRTSY